MLPASQLAAAVGRRAIDGAALSPTALFDFGVAPIAKNHYLLQGGATPLVLMMNRKKSDSLPEAAKALIREHSGERAAAIWIESSGAGKRRHIAQIRSYPQRKVIAPSQSDNEPARQAYRSLTDAWGAKSPRNGALLKAIETEIATLRTKDR